MSPRAQVEDRGQPDELMMLDPDTLDKTKHYRFVQERPGNLTRRLVQGYEVVLRSEHGVRLVSDSISSGDRADDQIRIGDSILMMCDKSKFKERRSQISRLAAARLGASDKQFLDNARKRGVRSLTGEEGETK